MIFLVMISSRNCSSSYCILPSKFDGESSASCTWFLFVLPFSTDGSSASLAGCSKRLSHLEWCQFRFELANFHITIGFVRFWFLERLFIFDHRFFTQKRLCHTFRSIDQTWLSCRCLRSWLQWSCSKQCEYPFL